MRKVDGVRRLSLTLGAPYFDSFRLCVTSPYRGCKRFLVRSLSGGVYGGRIDFDRHFLAAWGYDYTVAWIVDGNRIGRRLGFHVR